MTKISNKKKILIAVLSILSVILIAGSVFVVKTINNITHEQIDVENDNNKNNNDGTNTPIVIVPEEIVIDKLESCKYNFEIQNLGEHCMSISIEDENIASIDINNNIHPLSVGTTLIKLHIDCKPAIEKTTSLIINDAVTDFTYSLLNIDKTTAENFYVNQEYILQVKENAVVTDIPNIGYNADIITNFSFISKTENTLTYKFTVKQYGEFNFDYISKYCHKNTKSFLAYVYPSDFDVEFNNVTHNDNTINLYLFNNNYVSLANTHGCYNFCSFVTKIIDNSNDELIINNTNEGCVHLTDNTITALSEGSSILSFESKISHIKKEYNIVVQKISPTEFIYNDMHYDIGAKISLSLNVNEPTDFIFEIQPAYAYGNLELICSEGLSLSNNQLTLLSDNNQTIKVKFDNIIIASFVVQKVENPYYIDTNVYMCTSEYTFENNLLSVNYEKNAEIILKLEILDKSNNQRYTDQELYFEILDNSIIASSDNSNIVKNYFAMLTILQKGSTTIKIYSNKLNLSIIISIFVC